MDADRGLVDAAAAGSREAFDELVLRYQGPVLNLVRAMTAGDGDAEDAQEAFVRAWRSIASFRSDSTFRTWVFGIAINVVRTHRGKRARLRRLSGRRRRRNRSSIHSTARRRTTGSRRRSRCGR